MLIILMKACNMKNFINKIKSKLDLNRPLALSWDDWTVWHEKTKKEKPFVYFLKITLTKFYHDTIETITWPYNQVRWSIRDYITQRWHVVKTGLKPGYHEISDRMLHANFNLLVDFVEIEKAWMQILWNNDEDEKKNFPWWSLNPTRFSSFRNPQAGLKYLEWESKIVMDKDYSKNKKDWGKPTSQAKAAMEIIKLYKWWKDRQNRIDPHDASGWTEICDERRKLGHDIFSDKGLTENLKKREKKALEKTRKIEEKYLNEDESMLICLIKIREHLWT